MHVYKINRGIPLPDLCQHLSHITIEILLVEIWRSNKLNANNILAHTTIMVYKQITYLEYSPKYISYKVNHFDRSF